MLSDGPLVVVGRVLILKDPTRVFDGDVVRLCRILLRYVPDVLVRDVTPLRGKSGPGFKVCGSRAMLQSLSDKFADVREFQECVLELPVSNEPCFDVVMRGVDSSCKEEDIRAEVAQIVGCEKVVWWWWWWWWW